MLRKLTEKNLVYPLMTIVLIIKLILVEYYFFINELTNQFTLIEYVDRQSPVFLGYKIALIMIMVSWGYLFEIKKGLIYLASVNLINSLLALSMALYIKAFNKLPAFSSLYSVSDIGELGTSITFMLEPRYLLLFVDCFVMFFIIRKIKSSKSKIETKKIFVMYLLVGSFVVTIIPYKLESFARELGDPAYHFYHMDSLMAIENHSYISYSVLEIVRGLNSDDYIELTTEQLQKIEDWFSEKNWVDGDVRNRYFGVSEKKNIVLIQVESLESQLIDRTVGDKEIMPFLNAIKDESIYFPNILEQVCEGNSSDTELMINTSLYPIDHGVTFYQFAERDYKQTLPKILKSKGYYSVVAHGDRKTFWNRSNVYPGMGYDEFWGIEDYNQDDLLETAPVIGLGLSDGSFFTQSIEKISKLEKPFMASLITLTTHSPFNLPETEINVTFPAIDDRGVRAYVESFSYMDKVLEDYFAEMNKVGLLEDTLVVIYGDHEGINKYYEPPEEWTNNRRLPLIIYGADVSSATYSKVGGQIDIMPTILELVGIEPNDYWLIGKSLLSENERYVITPEESFGNTSDDGIRKIEKEGYDISKLILKSQKRLIK